MPSRYAWEGGERESIVTSRESEETKNGRRRKMRSKGQKLTIDLGREKEKKEGKDR